MDSWRTKFTASDDSCDASGPSFTWLRENAYTWAVVKFSGYFLVYKLIVQALTVMLVRKFSLIKDVVKAISEVAGPLGYILPWNSDVLRANDVRAQNDIAEQRLLADIRKFEADERLKQARLTYDLWRSTEELEFRQRQLENNSSNEATKMLLELAKMDSNNYFQARKDLEAKARLAHNMNVEDRKLEDKKCQDVVKNRYEAQRLANDETRAQLELDRLQLQKKIAEDKSALDDLKFNQSGGSM